MKIRFLLKASLLMGLIIAGRFARDAEQAHPGQTLRLDSLTQTYAPAAPPVAAPLHPVVSAPVRAVHSLTVRPAQAASLVELN